MTNFLEELAEILELEVEELTSDFEYQETEEWDSLAQLSLITLFADEYQVDVGHSDLIERKTVGQLLELLPKKIQ
ncbi:phosphopantetheine-binding protein [Shewanella algae]|uniref:phosphopantetheine-binding protein n=1 Tax=Shewanella algae TaxID=38313 RepID=UPI0005CD246F|nr:phosphopantetheine-binding protein [Shewanella algae]MCE9781764.1 phosphopantetheine-binding protein [Shewanella algae]